jgi:hypothetical protein
MVLPMDMKKLRNQTLAAGFDSKSFGSVHPKVAPDPSIYCPSVLITPFGPAPYLMMLTDPCKVRMGGLLRVSIEVYRI